ncbi:DNA cytosine methyltransferase [Endozoicomonas sp. GU-1]|uniref:DNA cytosine methyltransferase n=1 Tax=Endozoicomonas sp. GU-1 TaxID=3009078 RepID=UPI0022B51150|nr:DNA cytosine methyltransferase [Endozoicomonas sp. GU-1]WBA81357.1 DNA cytosine methyltransferase [Endozoicomonas sp. GU-1]WBA84305.1 DNA cytosine methyltransferase [Endozoicomonas sp. GU-1]
MLNQVLTAEIGDESHRSATEPDYSAISKKPASADFFAGSGLATEGLKDFFDSVWANDICAKKQAVFAANHSPEIFTLDSIENIKGDKLPRHSLSWASFPCQDLSLAGNMGGITSSRSGMVWQWLRILDEMREAPAVLVAENVRGLVSGKNGENYLALHNALLERQYNVGAVLIDAVHWVPQSRPRIFVIAVRKSTDISGFITDSPTWAHPKAIQAIASKATDWTWWNIPAPSTPMHPLEKIIELDAPFDSEETVNHHLSLIPKSHFDKLEAAVKKGQKVFPGYKRIRNGQQVLEVRTDGLAGCLRTPTGGSSRQQLVIYRNGKFGTRLLTVKEAAQLMGAHKYQIPGTYNQGYKAMGDAVVVPVVRHLAEHLLYPLIKK